MGVFAISNYLTNPYPPTRIWVRGLPFLSCQRTCQQHNHKEIDMPVIVEFQAFMASGGLTCPPDRKKVEYSVADEPGHDSKNANAFFSTFGF